MLTHLNFFILFHIQPLHNSHLYTGYLIVEIQANLARNKANTQLNKFNLTTFFQSKLVILSKLTTPTLVIFISLLVHVHVLLCSSSSVPQCLEVTTPTIAVKTTSKAPQPASISKTLPQFHQFFSISFITHTKMQLYILNMSPNQMYMPTPPINSPQPDPLLIIRTFRILGENELMHIIYIYIYIYDFKKNIA